MFRGSRRSGVDIDRLEPLRLRSEGPAAVEEIFGDVGRDHLAAARKILGWLQTHGDPAPLADAARRLIFLKGHDSHDYKYSSAVLEDYAAMSPPVRDRYLAAAAYYLKGTGDADNALVERIRNALA
jgi:hypothetical protein